MLKKIIIKVKRKGFLNTILFVIGTFLYRFARMIFDFYLRKVKIKPNFVVFYSTPNYSDNAKALYEYMLKSNDKSYTYIWLVNGKKRYNNDKNTIFINNKSKYHKGPTLKAIYYVAISKIVFFTHGCPLEKLKSKPEQLIINLWHGCGYKSKAEAKKTFIEENYFDYVLVPGKIFVKNKSTFFGCPESKILDIGYPRYDILLKKDKKTEKFVNKLKKNNKLIVWMPTFRKTLGNEYPEEKTKRNYDLPILSSNNDLIELDKMCKKNNIVLYIKRHPYQIEYTCEKETLFNIHFIDQEFFESSNIDLYSFLHYTDGLITDYSSISIDYLLLDKPIAYTLDDFESYNNSRGFAFENPKEYMPGHHLYDFNDMIDYLKDIIHDNDIYKKKRKEMSIELHNKCDDYCARIMETIENIVKEK